MLRPERLMTFTDPPHAFTPQTWAIRGSYDRKHRLHFRIDGMEASMCGLPRGDIEQKPVVQSCIYGCDQCYAIAKKILDVEYR